MKNGASQAYLLDEHTRISFNDDKLILITPTTSEEILLANVVSYSFSDGSSINSQELSEGEYLKIADNILLCVVTTENEKIRIWNDSGQLVMKRTLTANIENIISLGVLPHGVYLAKVKGLSIKILL